MRPVLYNDVLAAVSLVAACPPDRRKAATLALFEEARQAAIHAARFQSAHPVFGDGTLVAAALRHGKRGDTSFQTECGLSAWAVVIEALRDHARHPDAQLTHRLTDGSNSRRFAEIASPQSSQ